MDGQKKKLQLFNRNPTVFFDDNAHKTLFSLEAEACFRIPYNYRYF